VEKATDYNTAIEKVMIYDYDCILLDISLPGGSGLKILIRYTPSSITIANSGNATAVNVFERYRNASIDGTSSGLGLSIVKSIAARYEIDITYRYDEMHIFTLHLK
jgi:DNA-binding NtrC family response regulator